MVHQLANNLGRASRKSTVAISYISALLIWAAAGLAGMTFDFKFKEAGNIWSYSNIGAVIVILIALLNLQIRPVQKKSAGFFFFTIAVVAALYFYNFILTVLDEAKDGQIFALAAFRSFIAGWSIALLLSGLKRGEEIFLKAGAYVTGFLAIFGALQVYNGWCFEQRDCQLVIPHLIYWHKPFGVQLYRASGGLIDPNVYAALMCLGVGASLRIIRSVGAGGKYIWKALFGLQLLAVFLAGSRGGVLAVSVMLFFSLALVCIRTRRKHLLAVVLIIVGSIPTAFFGAGVRSVNDNSTSERVAILQRSWEYLEKFPSFFGRGFLHFNRVSLDHMVGAGLVAHNTPIELIENNGLSGWIIFFYFLFLVIYRKRMDELILGFLVVSLFLSLQSNFIFGLWIAYLFIQVRNDFQKLRRLGL